MSTNAWGRGRSRIGKTHMMGRGCGSDTISVQGFGELVAAGATSDLCKGCLKSWKAYKRRCAKADAIYENLRRKGIHP